MQMGMKIITAGISYATAIAVYKLIPLALAIPSPVQLEKEINERKDAQRKLQAQFKRSIVLSKVTKEIRRSLKLQDICNATAVECIDAFNADVCSVYRCAPDQTHSSLDTSETRVDTHTNETDMKGKAKEDNDSPNNRGQHSHSHTWTLLSEYDRRVPDDPKTNKKACCRVEAPLLHLLPG
jgi:hypothetical protein